MYLGTRGSVQIVWQTDREPLSAAPISQTLTCAVLGRAELWQLAHLYRIPCSALPHCFVCLFVCVSVPHLSVYVTRAHRARRLGGCVYPICLRNVPSINLMPVWPHAARGLLCNLQLRAKQWPMGHPQGVFFGKRVGWALIWILWQS